MNFPSPSGVLVGSQLPRGNLTAGDDAHLAAAGLREPEEAALHLDPGRPIVADNVVDEVRAVDAVEYAVLDMPPRVGGDDGSLRLLCGGGLLAAASKDGGGTRQNANERMRFHGVDYTTAPAGLSSVFFSALCHKKKERPRQNPGSFIAFMNPLREETGTVRRRGNPRRRRISSVREKHP